MPVTASRTRVRVLPSLRATDGIPLVPVERILGKGAREQKVRIRAFEHTDRYQGDPSEVADVGDRTGIQVDGVALGFEESVTVRVLHGGFPYCLNKRGGPAFC